METLNTGTAFFFAVISLAISVVTIIDNSKSSKRELFTTKMDFYSKVLDWYKETIGLMKQIECKSDMKESCKSELALLSALVEYGRFFFPNIIDEGEFGNDKPEAYKGFRAITLDFIVAYYNLFNLDLRSEYPSDAPNIIQRYFTSEVFKSIKPQNYIKQAEKAINTKMNNQEQLRYHVGKKDQNFIIDLVFNQKT